MPVLTPFAFNEVSLVRVCVHHASGVKILSCHAIFPGTCPEQVNNFVKSYNLLHLKTKVLTKASWSRNLKLFFCTQVHLSVQLLYVVN